MLLQREVAARRQRPVLHPSPCEDRRRPARVADPRRPRDQAPVHGGTRQVL